MMVVFLVRGFGAFLALMLAFLVFWVLYLTAAAIAAVALCVALIVAVAYMPRMIRNHRRMRQIQREGARRSYREQVATKPLDRNVFEAGVDAAYVQNRGVNL